MTRYRDRMQQSQIYDLQKKFRVIHKPEMMFAQWYEVRDEKKLCDDKIDKIFRCVQLRRQQTEREAGRLSSAADYGLMPGASTRSFVHLLERNLCIQFVG